MVSLHCEGCNISVVTILQPEDHTVGLVRLVPAVADLVAPPPELDALAVITGELGLRAASELQGGVVGLAIVTTWQTS